jgi:hypothetical protein
LERKGEVAYQLELPDSLSDVHDVFHVSQLKKCLRVLGVKLLTCAKFSGVIIQKMRPLGKEKMNSGQNFPGYSQKFLNLEDEILLRG